VIRLNSTIFSLVELGNFLELGKKPEKETVMKNLLKKSPRSDEAVNETTYKADLETANASDQDDVAAVQGVEPMQDCDEPSGDLWIDVGISLPSSSRAERKVAVKSKGHFCGHLVVGDCEEQVIAVESHLEMNCALILSARPDVIEFREQVGFPWVDKAGANRVHYFDFLVTLRDGTTIAIFVKPLEYSLKEKFVSDSGQIAPQVTSAFADRVVLMTEYDINPIELYNAELMHSVRLSDPDVDRAAMALVKDIQGSVSVADLVKEIAVPGQGFRAVVRLIRKNILELVAHERIAPSAMLRRRVA
jgi:hypothetical protein